VLVLLLPQESHGHSNKKPQEESPLVMLQVRKSLTQVELDACNSYNEVHAAHVDKSIMSSGTPKRISVSVNVGVQADVPIEDEGSAPAQVQGSGPDAIVPNDLFAVRDLLLVGHGAIFMQPDSAGAGEVKKAAIELAKLMPKLHPHEDCRRRMATLLEGSSEDEAMLKKLADEAWACLPGDFTINTFDSVYDPSNVTPTDGKTKEFQSAFDAKMPLLKDDSILGACKGSQWPRTCSYWAALHSMAYLADFHGLSAQFLGAVVPVIAGGATLCHGCTMHFRLMHEPMLSQNVLKDTGSMF